MAPEIVTGITRLIDRRAHDLRSLSITWFGGEPLMAKDIVFDVTEHAHRVCRAAGIAFDADTITNGYLLTEQVAARLGDAGHTHFTVSVAGLGPEHDKVRPLVSGKGSFERIWSNLLSLHRSALDFRIQLSLHFGRDPQPCEALCREVNHHFGGDSRFYVSLQPISDFGPKVPSCDIVPPEQVQETMEALAALMPDIEVAGLEPWKPIICMAASPNHLVIRTDGRIGRCPSHLEDPRTTVGRLMPDGRVCIDKERMRPWLRGYDEFDVMMLGCPLKSVPQEYWPDSGESIESKGREAGTRP